MSDLPVTAAAARRRVRIGRLLMAACAGACALLLVCGALGRLPGTAVAWLVVGAGGLVLCTLGMVRLRRRGRALALASAAAVARAPDPLAAAAGPFDPSPRHIDDSAETVSSPVAAGGASLPDRASGLSTLFSSALAPDAVGDDDDGGLSLVDQYEATVRALADATVAGRDAQGRVRSRDELLSALSHDLRTPLNTMVGWLHVIKSASSYGPDALARATTGLERAIAQQRDIVDALHEARELAGGRLPAGTTVFELGALVRNALDRLPPVTDEASGPAPAAAPLRLEPLTGNCWVEGDPARIEQALCHLLLAAARAGDPGEPLVVEVLREGSDAVMRIWPPSTEVPRLELETVYQGILDEPASVRAAPLPRRKPSMQLLVARRVLELHRAALVMREDNGRCFEVRLEAAKGRVATAT